VRRDGGRWLCCVVVEHRDLVERIVAGHDACHLQAVELAGPAADEDGGNSVSGEVGERSRLGHEPVDADDQSYAVHEVRTVRLQTTGQRGEPGAGDAGGTLRGQDHEQHSEICAPRLSGLPTACATNSDDIVR
jgi:hypothetical protein